MNSRLNVGALAALALGSCAGSAGAATLLASTDGGCGKTTCFNDNGVVTRTWSAKDFAGPVDISRLLLDRAVLGSLSGSTFRISFSLNGQELGTWGRFNMGGFDTDTLGLSGESFVWNPEDGDLVLTLALDPAPKPGVGGGAFFARDFDVGPPPPQGLPDPTSPAMSRQAAMEAAPVPEPTAWALMILGFGTAGAMLRTRPRPAPALVRVRG